MAIRDPDPNKLIGWNYDGQGYSDQYVISTVNNSASSGWVNTTPLSAPWPPNVAPNVSPYSIQSYPPNQQVFDQQVFDLPRKPLTEQEKEEALEMIENLFMMISCCLDDVDAMYDGLFDKAAQTEYGVEAIIEVDDYEIIIRRK